MREQFQKIGERISMNFNEVIVNRRKEIGGKLMNQNWRGGGEGILEIASLNSLREMLNQIWRKDVSGSQASF